MARKHAKKFKQKQRTTTVILQHEVLSETERDVVEVPEGTSGAHPIVQEDGTTKFFLVRPKVLVPARTYQRAVGSTMKRGQKNDPKNTAPKGQKGAK